MAEIAKQSTKEISPSAQQNGKININMSLDNDNVNVTNSPNLLSKN